MAEGQPREWLLLVYRVPAEPSRMRTYVWRQVKALGALYLQQAVWLLPKTERLECELQALALKIEGFGGEASVLTTTSPSFTWEERVIRGFNQARAEEYAEVSEDEERFEDEIRRETRKEKFTFAELEDTEANWEKLRRWFERVGERDFFGAPARHDAEARLAEGDRLRREFTRRVYEHERVAEAAEDQGGDGDGQLDQG